MAFGNDLALALRITANADQVKRELVGLRSIVQGEVKAITGSGGLGGLLAPAKLGAGAIAGIGVAAIAAGAGVFSLIKHSSDLGSKFFDLSQKTSFSVETLSSLRVAADKSGSSIEEVSTALVRFVNNLGEADKGNKEIAQTLNNYGITAFKDAETALAQFLERFAQLRTDQERTQAASEVFGKRTGAVLVATFNEAGGNLDAFKNKIKGLGLQMSGDAAQQADKFGDRLTELGLKAEGVGNKIANSLTPALDRLMDVFDTTGTAGAKGFDLVDFSLGNVVRGLADLLQGFKDLGDYIAGNIPLTDYVFGRGTRDYLYGSGGDPNAIPQVETPGLTPQPPQTGASPQQAAALKSALEVQTTLIKAELDKEKRLYDEHKTSLATYTERRIELARKAHEAEAQAIEAERALLKNTLAEEDAERAQNEQKRAALDTRAIKAEANMQREIEEARAEQRAKEEEAEREHRASMQALSAQYDLMRVSAIRELAEQQVITEAQAEERISVIVAGGFEKRKHYLEQERELAGADLQARQKFNDELEKLEAERAASAAEQGRKRTAAAKKDLEELIQQRVNFYRRDDELWELRDEKDRRRIEDRRKTGFLRESEALEQLAVIEQASMIRRGDALIEQLKILLSTRAEYGEKAEALTIKELLSLEAKTEREKELQHQLMIAEAERADAVEQATQRVLDARMREVEALNPPAPFELTEEQKRGNILTPEDLAQLGEPPDFSKHISAFELLKKVGKDAFGSLAQGMGSLIQSFLMGGKLGASAFAELAKSIAASLASQALVEAAMEVARGIAELAKAAANPITAPQHIAAAHLHFASALAFGAVGGIAAVAALAIPGGRGGSTGAGASVAGNITGRGGTAQGQQQERPVYDIGRGDYTNPAGRPSAPSLGTLRIVLDRGLIARHVVDDVRNNGRTRQVFIDVIEGR